METLRKPFFIAALVLIALAVLIELGVPVALPHLTAGQTASGDLVGLVQSMKGGDEETRQSLLDALDGLERGEVDDVLSQPKPPGLAIRYLAMVDGILLFTVAMMAVGLLIRERAHGKLHGCATGLFSLLMILGAIVLIIVALVLLLLMVAMFLAVPFGTLAYLAIYGFFDRGGASAVLSLVMTLRVAFGVCLLLAQRRFLQNKSLVLLTLTAFLASVIISLLQGIVPVFLVSITDALAAIIVGILAVIWAIVLLIASIPSVLKVLRIGRA